MLSEEAQALWQFHPTSTPAGANNPPGPDGRPMGPEQYALRRMPVRRIMYEKFEPSFIELIQEIKHTVESGTAQPVGAK